MCSGCAPTYYLRPDSTCHPCPSEGDALRTKLATAVPFMLMMLGLYVAIAIVLFRLEVTTGVSRNAAVLAALNEGKNFCVCFGFSFQIMASSAACMPSNLPSDVSYLFAFTSFFNADPSAITYEGCGGQGYPFSGPLSLLVMALVLLALHGAIELIKRRRRADAGDAFGVDSERDCLAEGQKVTHGGVQGTKCGCRDSIPVAPCIVPRALLQVAHGARGQGIVVKIDPDDTRGKPVVVQYESGDVHHYSVISAKELARVQPGPRKLSVLQGFVLTPLMALYPLITKTCLRFLHCKRCCACASALTRTRTMPTRTHAQVPQRRGCACDWASEGAR
jgi:hypothetical protein